MIRRMLRAKIHRAHVTGADLNYEGSITIDRTLMEAADILPNERVLILNVSNGSRSETYAIPGERDSGSIVMNGAIARMVQVGDFIIVLSFVDVDEKEAERLKPNVVLVDEKNRIIQVKTS